MRKHKKKRTLSDAEVNMTPMLDIVFIMLIFFVVSSTFVNEIGLDLTEYKSNDKPKDQLKVSKVVRVKVCENKNVLFNERAIDVRSVRANVERKLAEDMNLVVIVQSEKKASTGDLVMAIDQVRSAKAKISISPDETVCSSSA